MKQRYNEEDIEIIRKARKANKDKRVEARLKAIEMRMCGQKAKTIAEQTGYHYASISRLMKKYRDNGLEAITGNHYGGNRRNMSIAEEAALLAPFQEKAELGQIVEVSEIKDAYEKAVGHSIGGSQIYYVLHRHDWRKVMPRGKHPKKASDEAIDASKKLKLESKN